MLRWESTEARQMSFTSLVNRAPVRPTMPRAKRYELIKQDTIKATKQKAERLTAMLKCTSKATFNQGSA